jgi:hypothetical protein
MSISSATAVSVTELSRHIEPRPQQQSVADKVAEARQAEPPSSDVGLGRGVKIDFKV